MTPRALGPQVNICADAAACGPGAAGCELEDGHALSPVGAERTLRYSTDGLLTLTYKGVLDEPTGDRSCEVVPCRRRNTRVTLTLGVAPGLSLGRSEGGTNV